MLAADLDKQHVLALLRVAESIAAHAPAAPSPGVSDQLHYLNLAVASLLSNMNPLFPGYDKVCFTLFRKNCPLMTFLDLCGRC